MKSIYEVYFVKINVYCKKGDKNNGEDQQPMSGLVFAHSKENPQTPWAQT